MANNLCAGLNRNSSNHEIKEKAFQLLKNIREVALGTINKNKPSTRIVVIASIRDDHIYFMTARGKPMYRQLNENPCVSIVGKLKEDIMVRVEGEIKFMEDKSFLLNLIKGHEGMYTGKTDVLEMFYLSSCSGEIFDLTEETPKRLYFTFGDGELHIPHYEITDECVKCGICADNCVTGAINKEKPYFIDNYLCINCGRCFENCPEKVIKYIE